MPNHIGNVYKFSSAKVAKRDSRAKYHLAIDLNCGFLLFVNSEPFDGAMQIDRNDWPEMPNQDSFISCNAAVRYSKSDLKGIEITAHGRMTDDCLRRLCGHLEKSIVMPVGDIGIAVKALLGFFDT